MTQFATAQELADRLETEFSAADESRADGLLTRVSGLVQAEARQVIERVEDDEFVFYGIRETSVLLPERPVVSVSSVTIDGEPLEVNWTLDGDHLVHRFGWPLQARVVVTYTHGYEPVPDAIKEVVLGAVVRGWVNPGNVMSERLGQAQMTYAVQGSPPGMMLTTDERRTVRHVVGRGAESLPIR